MDAPSSPLPRPRGTAGWQTGQIARGVSIPLLLAGLLAACGGSAPITPSPIPPSPTPPSPIPTLSCVGNGTVEGVVSERTPDGIRPISGAIVELFFGDSLDSHNIFNLNPIKATLTNAVGGYFMCLPDPPGGTGRTGDAGQQFVVRVRKDGYPTASQSFRFAYSVWDYGGVKVTFTWTVANAEWESGWEVLQ